MLKPLETPGVAARLLRGKKKMSEHRNVITFTLCDAVATTSIQRVQMPWVIWAHKVINQTKPHVAPTKEDRDTCTEFPLVSGAVMRTLEEGAQPQDWYLPNGNPAYSRSDKNIDRVEALILDFDNDPEHVAVPVTLEQIKERLQGLEYVYWTSYSHGSNKYEGVKPDMFRVVLPLREPVSVEEFKERTDALMELFPEADKAIKRPSQPYYVPIVNPNTAHLYQCGWQDTGEWFDFLALPVNVREEYVPTATFITTDEVAPEAADFWIKLANGRSVTAAALYDQLRDGEKASTYRIGDANDRKPGAFLYKRGSGLICYNEDGSKNRFIRCRKAVVFDEAEPVKLWTKRSELTQAIVAQKTKPIEEHLKGIDAFEMANHQVQLIELNDRYLPSDLHLAIPEEGVVLVKSPKGTGKTTALAPIVAEARKHPGKASSVSWYVGDDGNTQRVSRPGEETQSVLLIGHRVNLLRELSERLDLDYYLDLPDGETSPYMAVCMDSLTRFDEEFDAPRHTVIIDESEQVFSHLLSETLRGRRNEVFNILIWVLRTAKRVILLDADLTTSMTMELITMIRTAKKIKSEPFVGITNSYVFEGRKTIMYESWHHLLAEAVEAARSGERVFISTNVRESVADVLAPIFRELGKKVLLVTSLTTATDPDVVSFMTNTTEESKKYDVVICTPTVQTGVSIDNDHFQHVYGFFWWNIGTFQDIDQAMSRVRRVDTHKVWVQRVEHKSEGKTEQEIFDEAIDTEKRGARKIIFGEEKSSLTKGERLWAEIYARIAYMQQEWSRFKYAQFIDLRKQNGYAIEFMPTDKNAMTRGKDLFDAASELRTDSYPLEVWNAKELSKEEFETLERKKKRSRDEQLQVERERYRRALGEHWGMDTLVRAVQQDMLRTQHRLRQLAVWDFESQLKYDAASRERNKVTFTDATHLTMRAGLYETLCESIGTSLLDLVDQGKRTLNGEPVDVEITSEQLERLAATFNEHKQEFSRYLKCRIKDPTDSKNLKKVWDATLGVFFPLKKVRTQKDGQRVSRYYINFESIDVTLKFFEPQ